MESKRKQTKITENLEKLPRNRRIMLEREMERERRLNLQEAKEEVWKKWRQCKGRRKTNPQKNRDRGNLDEKLKKVEIEVKKYEEELKRMEEEKQKKDARLERKRRMEKHWEMLRWLIKFMDENDKKWKELKKLRQTEREEQEKKRKVGSNDKGGENAGDRVGKVCSCS